VIILINGPPRSGKDTAAAIIKKLLLHSSYEYKLSRPLKRGVQYLYDIEPTIYRLLEDSKDEPTSFLFGQTYRQAQIDLYHCLAKSGGEDVLAKMATQFIDRKVTEEFTIISDSGRTAEANMFVKHYGYDKVGLIQLERSPCNFDNDVREYVDINCCHCTWIINDHDLEIFEAQIKKVLLEWNLELKPGL
tara:strand:+ start:637 stop:1206 length:570 start_codon:yes stop_codon:yes gene_type:complete